MDPMHPMDRLLCEIERLTEALAEWTAAHRGASSSGGGGGGGGASGGDGLQKLDPVQQFFDNDPAGELMSSSDRRSRIEVHNASDGTLLLRIDDREKEASLNAYTVAVGPGEHYVSPQGADVTGRVRYRWVTLPMDPAPPAGLFLEATGGWLMYSETRRPLPALAAAPLL